MQESNLTRRTFVKNSGLVTAGAVLAPYVAQGFTDDKPIRVGLVGCGGRGCGAVGNAMAADPKVELIAIGDLFEDRIKQRSNHLAKICGPRYKVTKANKFTGFDCYKKVIDAGVDYVILASPPAFRPAQLEYAVEKGIHCFYEKPVAVDAPGIRKVIELAKKAKEKKLGFMSGFCWRYNFPKRAVFSRVLDGAVGEINAMYSTYNAGEVGGNRGRTGAQSDLEIQMRNWPKHLWLAGDSIVEQAVHSIDMMQWAMGEGTTEAEEAAADGSIPTIPTAMVIFTITLPLFTNGQTVHGDTISHASKTAPREATNWKFLAKKDFAVPKTGTRSWRTVKHQGVTPKEITICTRPNMRN